MKDNTFKIFTFGSKGSGKTSICLKFCSGLFNSNLSEKIGVDFFVKKFIFGDLDIKLHVWDLGGNSRFEFLYPSYMRESDGALIVFDLKDETDYMIIKKKISYIRESAGLDIPFIIVGNKVDLIEDDYRKNERQDIYDLAKKEGNFYFETSAKTGHNLEECFLALVKQMMKLHSLLEIVEISNKVTIQEYSKIKEIMEIRFLIINDIIDIAKTFQKQGNYKQAKMLLQDALNRSIQFGLQKYISKISQAIKNLDVNLYKIQEKLISQKKEIHNLIYEEKLIRCPLHEEINTHCEKINSIKEFIKKPVIFGFIMHQFPKDNEYEYLKEVEKIKELINEVNEDPLIEIRFPSESTSLDVKTCDFCKFARAFDFGILLLTPPNPNAYLEAGMFIILGKKVILLNNESKSGKAPFDLTPYFYIPYKNLDELEKNWNQKILKYIQNIKDFYLSAS